MSYAARIREWLADNPGWHFPEDIMSGMAPVDRDERNRLIGAVHTLVDQGCIDKRGARRMSRYRLVEVGGD